MQLLRTYEFVLYICAALITHLAIPLPSLLKLEKIYKRLFFVVFPTFVVVSVTISALFSRHFSALGISYTPIYNALK